VSQWVVDASLTLQWYLKDEEDRDYSLSVLAGLSDNEAVVPFLWAYEVSNALVMAYRRKRLAAEEISEILDNLSALPIMIDQPGLESAMRLPSLALAQELTVYDAAYLELALRLGLPMATKDKALRRAMANTDVQLVDLSRK
jgi:predicted nucleic acid-binding protein